MHFQSPCSQMFWERLFGLDMLYWIGQLMWFLDLNAVEDGGCDNKLSDIQSSSSSGHVAQGRQKFPIAAELSLPTLLPTSTDPGTAIDPRGLCVVSPLPRRGAWDWMHGEEYTPARVERVAALAIGRKRGKHVHNSLTTATFHHWELAYFTRTVCSWRRNIRS